MVNCLYMRNQVMTTFVHPLPDYTLGQPGSPADLQMPLNFHMHGGDSHTGYKNQNQITNLYQ